MNYYFDSTIPTNMLTVLLEYLLSIYCTPENFARENFWQTIQVKAMVKKNLVNKLKSVYIGEENFGE